MLFCLLLLFNKGSDVLLVIDTNVPNLLQVDPYLFNVLSVLVNLFIVQELNLKRVGFFRGLVVLVCDLANCILETIEHAPSN